MIILFTRLILISPFLAYATTNNYAVSYPMGPDRIKNIYKKHLEENPHSCETIYYGLFTNGVKIFNSLDSKKKLFLPEFFDLNANSISLTNQSKIVTDFSTSFDESKESMKSFLGQTPYLKDFAKIKQEWIDRVKATKLMSLRDSELSEPFKISDLGDFAFLYKNQNSGPQLLTENSFFINSKNETRVRLNKNKNPDKIRFGGARVLGLPSKAVNLFYLSHELTHTLFWNHPTVAACLRSEESYGAKRIHPLIKDKKLKLSRYNNEVFHWTQNARGIPDIPKDEKSKLKDAYRFNKIARRCFSVKSQVIPEIQVIPPATKKKPHLKNGAGAYDGTGTLLSLVAKTCYKNNWPELALEIKNW